MDPISILGAAGSVVGVAAFGLQLAQVLDKFIEGYATANESLEAILDGIYSTRDALEHVQGFLEQEDRNVKNGRPLQLFSTKALTDISNTSDKCLKIFWRIEGTILRTSSSELETTISQRLVSFHQDIKENRKPSALQVDRKLSLSRLQRWRWSSTIGDKLEKYCRQLHRHQTTLILMFEVVSLQYNMKKT